MSVDDFLGAGFMDDDAEDEDEVCYAFVVIPIIWLISLFGKGDGSCRAGFG